MENLKIKADVIQQTIDSWDTIICSVSSAKRNGKITNRITWVRRDNPEKCIKSFVEKYSEKLTNYILGKVELYPICMDGFTPNHIQLVEHVDKTIGEVKYFKPSLDEDGYWVYELDDNLSCNAYFER